MKMVYSIFARGSIVSNHIAPLKARIKDIVTTTEVGKQNLTRELRASY